jgi:xylulokinase
MAATVIDAAQVAGKLLPSAARELGLPQGIPVLPGLMDTSAAVMLTGAKDRTLFNVSGSTDVLALCVDDPKPHERLLTRPTGVGRKWMAVSTIASAGTTLTWLHQTLFADLSQRRFYAMVRKALNAPSSAVRFDPYLAGDRMSIEQKQGGYVGLTLASTREQMLQAALDALAKQSAERIPLFQQVYGPISRNVSVGGGVGEAISAILHRDWPGKWTFRPQREATLRGLYLLAERAVG